MRYAIKYGPEILNEFDGPLDDAIELIHYESEQRGGVRLYLVDGGADTQVYSTEWPLPEAPRGAYDIISVHPEQPGALVCGTCGRAWMHDITPASRCPWEHLHVSASDGWSSEEYDGWQDAPRDDDVVATQRAIDGRSHESTSYGRG